MRGEEHGSCPVGGCQAGSGGGRGVGPEAAGHGERERGAGTDTVLLLIPFIGSNPKVIYTFLRLQPVLLLCLPASGAPEVVESMKLYLHKDDMREYKTNLLAGLAEETPLAISHDTDQW